MIQAILAIVGVAALTVLVFFFRYFLTGTGGLVAWAKHAGIKGWIHWCPNVEEVKLT